MGRFVPACLLGMNTTVSILIVLLSPACLAIVASIACFSSS